MPDRPVTSPEPEPGLVKALIERYGLDSQAPLTDDLVILMARIERLEISGGFEPFTSIDQIEEGAGGG